MYNIQVKLLAILFCSVFNIIEAIDHRARAVAPSSLQPAGVPSHFSMQFPSQLHELAARRDLSDEEALHCYNSKSELTITAQAVDIVDRFGNNPITFAIRCQKPLLALKMFNDLESQKLSLHPFLVKTTYHGNTVLHQALTCFHFLPSSEAKNNLTILTSFIIMEAQKLDADYLSRFPLPPDRSCPDGMQLKQYFDEQLAQYHECTPLRKFFYEPIEEATRETASAVDAVAYEAPTSSTATTPPLVPPPSEKGSNPGATEAGSAPVTLVPSAKPSERVNAWAQGAPKLKPAAATPKTATPSYATPAVKVADKKPARADHKQKDFARKQSTGGAAGEPAPTVHARVVKVIEKRDLVAHSENPFALFKEEDDGDTRTTSKEPEKEATCSTAAASREPTLAATTENSPFDLVKNKRQLAQLKKWLASYKMQKKAYRDPKTGHTLLTTAFLSKNLLAAQALVKNNFRFLIEKNSDGTNALDVIFNLPVEDDEYLKDLSVVFNEWFITEQIPHTTTIKNHSTGSIETLDQAAIRVGFFGGGGSGSGSSDTKTHHTRLRGGLKGQVERLAIKSQRVKEAILYADDDATVMMLAINSLKDDSSCALSSAIRMGNINALRIRDADTKTFNCYLLPSISALSGSPEGKVEIDEYPYFGALVTAINAESFDSAAYLIDLLENPHAFVITAQRKNFLHAVLSPTLYSTAQSQRNILALVQSLYCNPRTTQALLLQQDSTGRTPLHYAAQLRKCYFYSDTDTSKIVGYLLACDTDKRASHIRYNEENRRSLPFDEALLHTDNLETLALLFRELDRNNMADCCRVYQSNERFINMIRKYPTIIPAQQPDCIPLLTQVRAYNVVKFLIDSRCLSDEQIIMPLAGTDTHAVAILSQRIQTSPDEMREASEFAGNYLLRVVPPDKWFSGQEIKELTAMLAGVTLESGATTFRELQQALFQKVAAAQQTRKMVKPNFESVIDLAIPRTKTISISCSTEIQKKSLKVVIPQALDTSSGDLYFYLLLHLIETDDIELLNNSDFEELAEQLKLTAPFGRGTSDTWFAYVDALTYAIQCRASKCAQHLFSKTDFADEATRVDFESQVHSIEKK